MPLIEMDNHKTNERLDKIMAAIDDLNAAVATLQTTVTSVVTALGTSGTNNDAQVEVNVADIIAANAALQAALAPPVVVTTPVTTAPVTPTTTTMTIPETPLTLETSSVPKPGDPGYRQTS
jgi:hypothetical protein